MAEVVGKADDQLFQLLTCLLRQVLSFPFSVSRFSLLSILPCYLYLFLFGLIFFFPHLISIFVNRFRLTPKKRYMICFCEIYDLSVWICDVKGCLNGFGDFCNLIFFFLLPSSLFWGSLKINLSLIEYIFVIKWGYF